MLVREIREVGGGRNAKTWPMTDISGSDSPDLSPPLLRALSYLKTRVWATSVNETRFANSPLAIHLRLPANNTPFGNGPVARINFMPRKKRDLARS